MAEDVQSLAERGRWTVTETAATYAPVEGGWRARVTLAKMSGHLYQRWHVAVIDARGVARYTCFATLIGEAVRIAEVQVRHRNAVPA